MIFFGSLIFTYSLLLVFFTFVWRRKQPPFTKTELHTVSVIVAFRNEEKSLPLLVHSFQNLEYPEQQLEFIFVNDHSEDHSNEVLRTALRNFPFKNQLLGLPEDEGGKKEALMAGIGLSAADIILMTDADCVVASDWVQQMQAPFQLQHVQLVSGNVVFKAAGFLQKIFQMEFAPLIGVGAVTIKLGEATMANGANLAVRRKTFLALEVYEDNAHIPTGDDVFLLQKVANSHPKGVYFQSKSVVETDPPDNLLQFFHQRIRWASKWKAVTERKSKIPALTVWFFHFMYMLGFLTFIYQGQFFVALSLFIGKAVGELVFIYSILKSQKQKFHVGVFFVLALFYSLYVIIFGLLANFAIYQWKGRTYGKHER